MKKGILLGILGGVILIVLAGLLLLFGGWLTMIKVIQWVLIIAAIIGFLILIGWVIYYFIFKKHKFDATAVNRKKLIMAAEMQCPDTLKGRNLRLSGDKGHSGHVFGRITGYLQVQILTKEAVYDKNGNQEMFEYEGKQKPKYKLDEEIQDLFVLRKRGFPFSLFEDPYVVRVKPKDHDELVGDVTLYGINLVPLSEYWFLSHDYLDARKIDMAILHEAERGIMFEMLKDTKSIVDMAINLDARHRKGIEDKHLVEVPQLQQVGLQSKS